MNAGFDVGPTQLCVVALSRIRSLVPFDWQNKKSFFTVTKFAEQNFQVQKDGKRTTFLTLLSRDRRQEEEIHSHKN